MKKDSTMKKLPALTNTKVKIWVWDVHSGTHRSSIWKSWTGVLCAKACGELRRIELINSNVKEGMGVPARVTHSLGRKYTVPKLPSERAEKKVIQELVSRVQTLDISKDERRIIKKMSNVERGDFRNALLFALLKNVG